MERVLFFALQELMELFGGKRYVDLGSVPDDDPESMDLREECGMLYRDLAIQSGAGMVMTGSFDPPTETEGRFTQNFRVEILDPRSTEEIYVKDFSLTFDSGEVGPHQDSGTPSEVDFSTGAQFQAIVAEIFTSIRTLARWRYSNEPDDRKYFDFRLRQGLSQSFNALRSFVRARRFSSGPESKLFYYKRCLTHDPCLGAALRNVAFLYKEQKKYNLALLYYNQAVTNLIDRATLSEAYSEMGLCFANVGKLDSALTSWHNARRWDPSNTDVYANLGIGYEEKGVLDKAIRYFREAQKIDPDYYWACRGLGRIYCTQGEWMKAIEQLNRQIDIAPKDAWGHYALGSCHAHQGNLDEARDHLRRALELDPDGDAGRKAFQGLMQIDV